MQPSNNHPSSMSLTKQPSFSATKIPVNRIKMIMQANKEIGKIQQ